MVLKECPNLSTTGSRLNFSGYRKQSQINEDNLNKVTCETKILQEKRKILKFKIN
jgi:hypothetical protein